MNFHTTYAASFFATTLHNFTLLMQHLSLQRLCTTVHDFCSLPLAVSGKSWKVVKSRCKNILRREKSMQKSWKVVKSRCKNILRREKSMQKSWKVVKSRCRKRGKSMLRSDDLVEVLLGPTDQHFNSRDKRLACVSQPIFYSWRHFRVDLAVHKVAALKLLQRL